MAYGIAESFDDLEAVLDRVGVVRLDSLSGDSHDPGNKVLKPFL
jgi:hypothetical protein